MREAKYTTKFRKKSIQIFVETLKVMYNFKMFKKD